MNSKRIQISEHFSTEENVPVREASPMSVIWRVSKLSDLRDESPDSFFKPMSVTTVNERFNFSRLNKPKT